MSKSRKGLKKLGLRRYIVTGPKGVWIIERERPWRFVVRPEGWAVDPRGGFFQTPPFLRLYLARHYAETQAGLTPCPLPNPPTRLPNPPIPKAPTPPPRRRRPAPAPLLAGVRRRKRKTGPSR